MIYSGKNAMKHKLIGAILRMDVKYRMISDVSTWVENVDTSSALANGHSFWTRRSIA